VTDEAKGGPTPTYLGSLDRQMEAFLSYPDWERFLVASLLFEPELVVPDIFLFISHHLEQHLSERLPGNSLFEKAVLTGLITVALREPQNSLGENLTAIRRQGILGVLPNAENIARRIESVWRPRESPGSLHLFDQRERFQKMVFALMGDQPPRLVNESADAREAWNLSSHWRQPALAEAYERTLREDGRGLRRGHLQSAFGQRLGWKAEVHDTALLLRSITDPEMQRAAAVVLRWMHEIYQASSASVLGSAPGFPASVPEYAIVPYELLPRTIDEQQVETVTIMVDVPPTHVLLEMSPDAVLGARKEYGHDYLEAVLKWRRGASNEDAVRSLADSYCRTLNTWAEREAAGLPTRASIALTRRLGSQNANVVVAVLRSLGPIGAIYLTGDPSAAVVYRILENVGLAAHRKVDHLPEFKHLTLARKHPSRHVDLSVGQIDVDLL